MLPLTQIEPTDHQVIRALSRNTNNTHQQQQQQQQQQQFNYPSYYKEKLEEREYNNTNREIDKMTSSSRTKNKHLINNLKSTTHKFIRSITPHPHSPPLTPTTTGQQRPENPIQKNYNPLRSNSISSVYPRQRLHPKLSSNQQPTCIHQPVSSSSTDSINTHQSNSTHPLRAKLERKLTQLSHRLNQHNLITTQRMTHKPKSQSHSNLNQLYSCPNHNHNHNHNQPPNKSKSNSSSSLSSFFDQSIIRTLQHHPGNKSEGESQRTPPSPKPIMKPPSPAPSQKITSINPVTTRAASVDHSSPEDDTVTLRFGAGKRNYDPTKRTPHTIYLPIEQDPTTGFISPVAQLSNKSMMMSNTHHQQQQAKSNRLDKRQSPTQIALSRLDEILRGHHRDETTSEHADLNAHYGYQSIMANQHPSSLTSNSPVLDVCNMAHSLSPPLRTRKKINNNNNNNTKTNSTSSTPKPAGRSLPNHQHSQSLSNHLPHSDHHVLISPETWKSISISSKYHHHHHHQQQPLTSLN